MPPEEVAPGIFRLGNRTVNWWAIVTPEGLTIVDAGLRGHMSQLDALLNFLDRTMEHVKAVVLTHADVDHIGVAEDLRRRGVPIYIHQLDSPAAAGELRRLPKEMLLNLWRPRLLMAGYEYARDGAMRPRFLREGRVIADGEVLPVPGDLRVLHVPGHTNGSCAFLFEESSILFTGDALVTEDPLSGKRTPTLLPRYDNEDHELALRSLEKLAATAARLVLPGHGDAWSGGVVEATTLASVG